MIKTSVYITQALINLVPKTQWVLSGESYDDLLWLEPPIEIVGIGTTSLKPTREEIEAEINRIRAEEPLIRLRKERDLLLKESDTVVLKIIETNLANGKPVGILSSWATYRQELRDLPETVVDPDNPIFPIPPTEEQTNQELQIILEQSPEWKQFLLALTQTTVFTNVRQLSRVDVGANALATELRTSLGEAALGFAEPMIIQGLFNELIPSLTVQELTEIGSLIQIHRIPLSVGIGTT